MKEACEEDKSEQINGGSEGGVASPPGGAEFGFSDENQLWLKPAKKSAKTAKKREKRLGRRSLVDGHSDPDMSEERT